ncbi:MAG TPA: hypothetical protein VJA82_11720 [Sediminibacterium sp.]|uniref:DUF7935 family protein n=1 Tax=Sediminibacterium sp. TaxID=1917865 RepID=UPI0008AF2DEE|nr:hypothetical protein [Sediminibacterium sp.]OHC84351.1 MAG: hypothetical protein A2472_12915 [Sphingobacteriia bacterium RIFOXYC2_FULL_35_18]OHC88701.1 MAG: hypothetical protein A2546_02265 [Sphingobacteriia bacterium RIFOXYD2_FULL_35_12]HLD53965.1 hypothetical protein [Sediminibacterium sp.]
MDNSVLITVIVAFFIASMAGYLIYLQRRLVIYEKHQNKATSPLPLQAYERLLLLTDRIALPNLINRNTATAISSTELQLMYNKIIREEFDFNVTQQMYISPASWKAVKNLKEKNLQIINQIGQQLPAEATGLDLQKAIMQYLMANPTAALHELVSEALSYEAKQLL